jgi:hypothetical protein
MGKGATPDLCAEAKRKLDSGETILAMASGARIEGRIVSTDFVIVTDKRLFLWDRGYFSRPSDAFDFAEITNVKVNEGPLFASLAFNVHGRTDHFDRMDADDARRVAEIIKGKMSDTRPTSAPPTPTSATDIASQLEKLAALLEKGLLTKEEFQEQKRKLLS